MSILQGTCPFLLHPKGTGFVVGESRCTACEGLAKYLRKLRGQPSASISFNYWASCCRGYARSQEKVLVIDPTDLCPESTGQPVKRLLKRISGQTRSYLKHWKLFFLVDSPEQMMFDPIVKMLEDVLDFSVIQPDFLPCWSNMPKVLFSKMFSYFHPELTVEEAMAEANSLKAQAIKLLDENNLEVAKDNLDEANDFLYFCRKKGHQVTTEAEFQALIDKMRSVARLATSTNQIYTATNVLHDIELLLSNRSKK